MREQEFQETAAFGRANAEAIELTGRHCRNARLELVGGNSFGGSLLGVPLGLFEIRCEHAPPPHVQSPRATDLAVEFYRANCTDCVHRDGTGDLPNLATVSAERAAAEQVRADAARRAADERAARYRARRERRRALLSGEGHVVRDLGEALDRIDHPDPRTEPLTALQEQAVRHVLDATRAAPELFRPVLVESLVELATDTADPTALEALRALLQAGRCPPRRAVGASVAVLRRERSVEAGRLFALLEPGLTSADLSEVVDRLIELASGDHYGHWAIPVSTDGLLAASRVDLAVVIDRIVAHLASENEQVRQAGADAARELLAVDAIRIVALGPPLTASIRGEDAGYAGTPHPAGAALQALAEGWRGEPELTRQIVETAAAIANQHARDQLARVPWFLQRFRQPWDASPEATSQAIAFLARRAGGDWGDEAAAQCADYLRILAGKIADAVVAHIDGLLGALLTQSAPEAHATPLAIKAGFRSVLEGMERAGRQMQRDAARRRLAEAIGRCAAANTDAVLGPAQALFAATTGDKEHDRITRTAMLDVLEAAVSPETLRDMLPITYSALCDTDPAVRRGGIDLWVACARAADTLPELTELSIALLDDSYVVVHRAMLDKLPQLRLPDEVAPRLLISVAGWIATYADPRTVPQPEVLESALWSLWSLAQRLSDGAQTRSWLAVALGHVERCRPFDRERLLTAWWPDELKTHPVWVRTALATAADPDLVDYYNVRHEPLLEALFNQPHLLIGIPFADIEPLSTLYGSARWWRSLEPVELLQSAGRWSDAVTLASTVSACSRYPVAASAWTRAVSAYACRYGSVIERATVSACSKYPAAANALARPDAG